MQGIGITSAARFDDVDPAQSGPRPLSGRPSGRLVCSAALDFLPPKQCTREATGRARFYSGSTLAATTRTRVARVSRPTLQLATPERLAPPRRRDATGEVIVRGVRYWEILIGRVGLREVSVFGCCRSTSNKVALRASSGLPADTWLPGFVPSSITQWRPWAMRIDHPKLSAMFPRPRMKTSGQNGGSGGHRVQEVPLLQALTKRVTLRFNV
jgi:hypothetical protein